MKGTLGNKRLSLIMCAGQCFGRSRLIMTNCSQFPPKSKLLTQSFMSFVYLGRAQICHLSSKDSCKQRCSLGVTRKKLGTVLRDHPRRFYGEDGSAGGTAPLRVHAPWRVLFFGTDDFSVATLKALDENRFDTSLRLVDTLEVVTNKGETPVRNYADEADLKVHDWPIPVMTDRFDVGVLVSFGHLIPAKIIHMFPYGILNAHGSLLPRWRGASPMIHAILNGDPVTGITIADIRPKHFDIGPVLLQEEIAIPSRCTALELSKMMAPLGAGMMLRVLFDLPFLEKLERDQIGQSVTYAHKIQPSMAYVDWDQQTVIDIDRQFRAITHMFPLKTRWQGLHIKLIDMVDPDVVKGCDFESDIQRQFGVGTEAVPPGTPFYHKQTSRLLIRCKDGWAGFNKIIIKKEMTALEFFNGYLSKQENRDMYFESVPNLLNSSIHNEKEVLRK